jgi:hypothetical protein
MSVLVISGWLLSIHTLSLLLATESLERVKSSNQKQHKVLADGYGINRFRSTKEGSVKKHQCGRFSELHCEAKLHVIQPTSNHTLVGVHTDAPYPGRCETVKASANMNSQVSMGSELPRKILCRQRNRAFV